MSRIPSLTLAAALSVTALAACGGGAPSSPAPAGKPVSSPAGRPASSPADVAALTTRWWTWLMSIPDARSPLTDPTGERCAIQEPADTTFLAGDVGGSLVRRCRISAGRPVFLPVLNRICPLTAGQSAPAAIRACSFTGYKASADLDGQPLKLTWATSAAEFVLDVAVPNQVGLPAGHDRVVTAGVWLGPLQIAVGRHVLKFAGSVDGFKASLTYQLTVS